MKRIHVFNESSYPSDEVASLVEFAIGEFVSETTLVVVKHTTGRPIYSGWAARNGKHRWPRVFRKYVDRVPGAVNLVMIRVARRERFPMTYTSYRRGWAGANSEWPGWKLQTWQECVVMVAAHEAKHLEDYRDRPKLARGARVELACEKLARRVLDKFLATDYVPTYTATTIANATSERRPRMATKTQIETTTNHVRNADASEEAILVEKVSPLFSDESVQLAALRYGRKLIRFSEGKRSSTPPMGTLTQAQAATIAKALGIETKKKSKPATKKAAAKKPAAKKTPAASTSSDEVTPDPKPTKAAKRSTRKTGSAS